MQADLPVPGQVRAARTNPLLPSMRHTLQTPDTPSALNAEAVWNRKAPEGAGNGKGVAGSVLGLLAGVKPKRRETRTT